MPVCFLEKVSVFLTTESVTPSARHIVGASWIYVKRICDVIWFDDRLERTGRGPAHMPRWACAPGLLRWAQGTRGEVCRHFCCQEFGGGLLLASGAEGPARLQNLLQVTRQPHGTDDPAQKVITPGPRSPALDHDIVGYFLPFQCTRFPNSLKQLWN